jgi:hypothetical protein
MASIWHQPPAFFARKNRKARRCFLAFVVFIASYAIFEGACANPPDAVFMRDYFPYLLRMYAACVPQLWFLKDVGKCAESTIPHGVDVVQCKNR